MSVGFARPDVSQLRFSLFERSVHPELFRIFGETTVVQDDYVATIRICDVGHLVAFSRGADAITEVTAPQGHPLPSYRCCLQNRLKGNRDESVQFQCGVNYHVSYQLERLEPEVFLHFHEELLTDCNRAPLAQQFPSSNRLAPRPLSFIQTDVWTDSLLIHAFHTFPENCAVVKTQSLFEL